MAFAVTEYQKQFRETVNDEGKSNFDQVVALATQSDSADTFRAALPDQFKEVLKNETTVEGCVSKTLSVSNWVKPDGTAAEYKEPTAAVPQKAKAAKPTAAKTAEGVEAPKRRGNPEALKKAREAKGGKTAEQNAQDVETIKAAVIAHLEAACKGVVVHVKTICSGVTAAVAGKLTLNGNTNDGKVYEVIQAWVKAGNAPFTGELMEGRKKGYKLPA